MPLAIVGQAPSRRGDGRAFTGPSGDRLVRLLGVEDYLDLYRVCHLENLLTEVQPKLPSGRGDRFPLAEAEQYARTSLLCMLFLNRNTQVIACGHKVFKAYTKQKRKYFQGIRIKTDVYNPEHVVDVWCFPHPSGASPFWNEPGNFHRASKFIQSVRERSVKLDAQ